MGCYKCGEGEVDTGDRRKKKEGANRARLPSTPLTFSIAKPGHAVLGEIISRSLLFNVDLSKDLFDFIKSDYWSAIPLFGPTSTSLHIRNCNQHTITKVEDSFWKYNGEVGGLKHEERLFYKNNGVLVAQVAPGDWTISLQVNGSGQFCSVAEMIGPVDFDQSLIISRITDGVANSPSNDS